MTNQDIYEKFRKLAADNGISFSVSLEIEQMLIDAFKAGVDTGNRFARVHPDVKPVTGWLIGYKGLGSEE